MMRSYNPPARDYAYLVSVDAGKGADCLRIHADDIAPQLYAKLTEWDAWPALCGSRRYASLVHGPEFGPAEDWEPWPLVPNTDNQRGAATSSDPIGSRACNDTRGHIWSDNPQDNPLEFRTGSKPCTLCRPSSSRASSPSPTPAATGPRGRRATCAAARTAAWCRGARSTLPVRRPASHAVRTNDIFLLKPFGALGRIHSAIL